MKSLSESLLLGVSVLLLCGLTVFGVSLNVSPNLQQFFSGDSVSMSCVEDEQKVNGWTVKRTRGGQTEDCGPAGSEFGQFNGSSCLVPTLSKSDSTVYWCETSSGQSSDQIPITVPDVFVILEIPALPVMRGRDVTLCCKTKDGCTHPADFYQNENQIGSGPRGEFRISNVQQSHDGLYHCYVELVGVSPQSRLRVRDPPTTSDPHTTSLHTFTTSSPGPAFPSASVSSPPDSSSYLVIPVIAAVVSLVLLVLVLILVLQLRRNRKGHEEVTYTEVVTGGQGSSTQRPTRSSEPDVIYSSVKPGN